MQTAVCNFGRNVVTQLRAAHARLGHVIIRHPALFFQKRTHPTALTDILGAIVDHEDGEIVDTEQVLVGFAQASLHGSRVLHPTHHDLSIALCTVHDALVDLFNEICHLALTNTS